MADFIITKHVVIPHIYSSVGYRVVYCYLLLNKRINLTLSLLLTIVAIEVGAILSLWKQL